MTALLLSFILEFGPASYYARLDCNNFGAPIMVYDKASDRLRRIYFTVKWRKGYDITGKSTGGCIAA